ncbi:MAG: serine hydrolase [Labilithrix sp.]|nr:serine hydrolase [Labilithrix sp.]
MTMLVALLSACAVPSSQEQSDPTQEVSSALKISPCLLVLPELESVAQGAAKQLQDNGAPGWSVYVSRRVGSLSEPCVAVSSGGYARSHVDGYAAFTPDVSFSTASQSKIVTAAAVFEILRKNKLDPKTETIGKHLPAGWPVGPGVKSITFDELLRHRSGLFSAKGNSIENWFGETTDIQTWLMMGVTDPMKARVYANLGYALLNLLAARMEYGSSVTTSDWAGILMQQHVWTKFLSPNGFPVQGSAMPSCIFSPSKDALAYAPKALPAFGGAQPTPATAYAHCGAARWNFTQRNFGRFLDRLHHGDFFASAEAAANLPPGSMVKEFEERLYGFDSQDTVTNDAYVTKGGNLPVGDTELKSKSYIFLGSGTVVAAFINADSAIGDAVTNAWASRKK